MFNIIKIFDEDSEKLKELNEIYDNAQFKSGQMWNLNKREYEDNSNKNNLQMIDDTYSSKEAQKRNILNSKVYESYYDRSYKIINNATRANADLLHHTLKNGTSPYLFLKYTTGGYYKKHMDSQRQSDVRSDYSVSIFLNDDYEGGELCVDIGTQEIKYKLKAGEALVYPTGISHRVAEVTSGERRACVFWVQSAIRDCRIRNVYKAIDRIAINHLVTEDLNAILDECKYIRNDLLRDFGDYKEHQILLGKE